MQPSPPHAHELARLAALHSLEVLDTLPEAFSDALTSAAAAIAGVPIAAISLVDTDRQWFKSSCGFPLPETPREVSICAHALHDSAPFIVEDALADPRFHDNPLVTGPPGIRAYAGFPLVVDGHPVGALCVIDDRPRRFDPLALRQLGRLAEGAAAWLQERRRFGSTLRRTREQLRAVTFTDAVTGLPSRPMLQDRLAEAAARCERDGQGLTVLFIRIGESRRASRHALPYGAEDDALREVARRLAEAGREGDVLSRVGDDDFVIVRPGGHETSPSIEASRLAERVHAALRQPVRVGGHEVVLDAAIGVAVHPQDGPAERLVGHAALACARPEAAGSCCFFSQTIGDEDLERRELLAGLRHAASRGELALHFQPKFDARTGLPTGVEALLRWRHPQLGNVPPGQFIPLAEDTGLIGEIGDWVIAEALRQMAEWRAAGLSIQVAINLSARQLHDPQIAPTIAARIAEHGIDPAQLTVEITESVAMEDVHATRAVFAQIKACGVALSIDDFGTGYSSLAYLRRLQVDELKIDRSFVADLDQGGDAHLVAKAIVELAHALRMRVVAEGVETASQQATLESFGCDKLQGFLLARPMPAAALADWWRERLDGTSAKGGSSA